MVQKGDIVKLKEDHYLSEIIIGMCIVDEIQIFGKKRYHIKTLNKDSDGCHRLVWVEEKEVISLSKVREKKLNELFHHTSSFN